MASSFSKSLASPSEAEPSEDINVLPTRLLVKNLPKCDQSTVRQGFQGVSGPGLVNVKLLGDGSAVLEFADNDLLNKVLFTPVFIEDKKTTREIYEPKPADPNADCLIEVAGIDETVTEHSIRLYFENAKRSGGGKIEQVVVDYANKQAEIRFAYKQAAWRVAFQYRHRINDVQLHADYCSKVLLSSVDTYKYPNIKANKDKDTCWGIGVCPLPDGGCLVADSWNNKLKRLNAEFTVVESLPLPDSPMSICSNSKEAAVTMSGKNVVVIVNLEDEMKILREVKFEDRRSDAVAWHRGYLLCGAIQWNDIAVLVQYDWYSCKEKGRTVLEDEGRAVITLPPRSMAVSGERIYVALGDSRLVILDGDLNLVKVVRILHWTMGGCVGVAGNVFVCGRDESNYEKRGTVKQYNRDGEFINTIVSHEQLKNHYPQSVGFIKPQSILVVTLNNCDEIGAFYLK